MTLTLRVLQAPQGVSQVDPRPLSPGACPYSIGRGPDNDWILDDPDRHISKVHCRIEADGDGLYLVDVSSNGVFFASDPRPVGRGKRRPLDSGDSFRIGDYRIGVAREAEARLPPVADDLDPVGGAETGDGLFSILAGVNEASEHRAARSVTGAASDWLSTLPNGAVDEQVVRPLGWHAPPSTSLTDLPEDLAQPLSEFASLSEHVPAINAALQVGGAKTVLPTDWNFGEDGGAATSSATQMRDGGAGADWQDAQRALMEGATLSGLVADAPMAGDGRQALVRTGQILRRLVDALAAIEAVQRTTERDLGLSDGALPEEDLPTLLAGAVWAADEAATDVLIQRLAGMARAARALGVAMAETAGEVGAQIEPEAVEEGAREEARLAVGPLLRAAAWERYGLVHANLSGGGEAPAADIVLAPLRRFFSQRA